MKKHELPAAAENSANITEIKDNNNKASKAPVLRQKSRRKHRAIFVISGIAFILIIAASLVIWYYYPGTRQSDTIGPEVIYSDTPVAVKDYRSDNGSLLLSFDFIKTNFDPTIYWEPAISKVIVTTADKVIEMKTGQLTAYINSNPVEIDIPVTVSDGNAFLPIDFLAPLYKVTIKQLPSGVIIIEDLKKPALVMTLRVKSYFSEIPLLDKIHIPEDVPFLRERPSVRSPRIMEMYTGDEIVVVGEENNWYKVRTGEGRLGFIRKSHVVFKEIIPPVEVAEKPRIPWRPLGGKINLTWDYMSRAKTDMSAYKPIPGLNVISPTWFKMTDGEGNIENIASLPYMEWARQEGLQVWALFSNSFDPEITTTMLRSFETRKKVINQLLVLSELYGFTGINIDFENIDFGDRDYFSQFMRELAPYMHEQNLTVSIDVTVRSTNPNWSMCYDREAIGKVVDYMAVMTYDEHWSTSPEAGSVASLPWVKDGIERIIEQVPSEKLLLGVPFYARLWKETPNSDGTVKVSSSAITIPACANLLKTKNLTATLDADSGQNYCSYVENGITYKIWLEDEFSMRQRVRIVNEYGLPGVASWRKGFDTPGIWEAIKDELQRMP
ncbi:MAG: glycosyl hydrolase family 18 protein [Saccharofermentanales bacterium]